MKQSEYFGLQHRGRRKKYEDCEYMQLGRGNPVRRLSDAEIDEFKAHMNRLCNRQLRTRAPLRKNVA
jgi:hypothetical protein